MNKTLDKIVKSAVLAGAIGIGAKANADNIDPLTTYLQSSYTPTKTVANPNPTWGNIDGLTSINNGTEVAAVWDNGNLATYSADMSTQISAMGVTSSPTGIAEVPTSLFGLGGQFAVSDSGSIDFYDASGNFKGSKLTTSTSIRDITYDSKNNRIDVSTQSGTYALNADGSLTALIGANPYAVKFINLGTNGSGVPIDSMLQTGNAFYRSDSNGNIIEGPFLTNLGSGFNQGIAYTQTDAVMAVSGGFYIYSPLAFQPYMNYSVSTPEPGTLSILGLGAAALAIHFRKAKRCVRYAGSTALAAAKSY